MPPRAQRKAPWLRVVPTNQTAAAVVPAISDQELIDAVIRGDDRVGPELYDRLVGVVDRTLYRILGRREPDHDDLIQNTFEQIISTLTKRRFAGACSLSTWASTIAGHVGLNAVRARRRERRVLDRSETLDGPASQRRAAPDADRAVGARIELARLRASLAAIDPDKASAVFLHDVLGHDLAEIAVLTGVSVSAAQTRLVRGRKELAMKMAEPSREEP